ncbi:MAG: hypothetical protein IPG32_11365 [Saprospirales bacterium]|nr:hypothetical protein [Saprospirales bacterium]
MYYQEEDACYPEEEMYYPEEETALPEEVCYEGEEVCYDDDQDTSPLTATIEKDTAGNPSGVRVEYQGKQVVLPVNSDGLVEMQDGSGNVKGAGDLSFGKFLKTYKPDDVEEDRYMNPQTAAGLINALGSFLQSHPQAEILTGDASTGKGNSPRLAKGSDTRHETHYDGSAFDGRYLDKYGKSNQGPVNFDTDANFELFHAHVQQGFRFVVVGTNKMFNSLYTKLKELKKTYKDLGVIRDGGHNDHFHLGIKRVVKSQTSFKIIAITHVWNNIKNL